jgi:GNAT superfamily N-acetyltransferase
MTGRKHAIRFATVADAGTIARLLHDFNSEYEDPTPGVEALTGIAAAMLAAGEMTVLLGGEGPNAISLFRFRTSPWTGKPEAYLQELYVAPALRGRGIGRALLGRRRPRRRGWHRAPRSGPGARAPARASPRRTSRRDRQRLAPGLR